MVHTPAILMGVLATTMTSSLALPTFNVPAFDYPSLTHGDTPSRVLAALQSDGIVALQNVPNYASLRARYLRAAAECAAVIGDVAVDPFVSRKLFEDGTQRFTISTNAGRELVGSALATDAKCPGYRALYEEFSQTLEHAVNTFGGVLDKTSFTASDGERRISSRQLVSEAIRLDHFHAYEAAAGAVASDDGDRRRTRRELHEWSLPLHEDHGLFIAMSAPKLFDVVEGGRQLVERELASDASGLVIQTSRGERVRPVLKEDEVVLMMGTGASRWLKTSHKLPAVLHGMKMPEGPAVGGEGVRRLRAWFGKMTLLPAYQRMLLGNGAVFETHVNATTRYLMANEDPELKTVGCATGRQLQASAKCTYRQCKPKSSEPSEGPCAVICNRQGHGEGDAAACAASCNCVTSSSPAEVCWMLCVSNLPADVCALDKQQCDGQSMSCSVPTSAPSTKAPATPAPKPTSASPTKTTAPSSTTATPGSTSKPSTTASTSTTTPSSSTSSPSTPQNDSTTTGSASSVSDPITSESSAATADATDASTSIDTVTKSPTPAPTTTSSAMPIVASSLSALAAVVINALI